VVNVEFGYEHGPRGVRDKTYPKVQVPEDVVRRAWEIVTAGGYVVCYYTYTAWDVVRPEDTPPGYAYFLHLKEFFEKTRYWELDPADDLVSRGYCLANRGKEYVVFVENGQRLTIRLEGAPEFKARWFHTLKGEWRPGGKVPAGKASVAPPEEWKGEPVALLLTAVK